MSPFSELVSYAFLFLYFFLCTRASPAPAVIVTQTVEIDGQVTTRTVTQDSTGLLGITFTGSISRTPETPTAAANPPPPADKPNPIRSGLTSFGDSFAAGFGTGRTNINTCAQGQFSYGKLLAGSAPAGTFHERRECTGAVVVEVAETATEPGQVGTWRHPQTADVVTLSVGGNDLGFSEIIEQCFLRVESKKPPTCNENIQIARDKLQNGTLQLFTETTLVQIINKSTRDDLRIFLTGYPAFFNVDTQQCNNVSFSFWDPGRAHPSAPCDPAKRPCLTQELRRTVNDLTVDGNRMLLAAAQRVNAEKGEKVRFIDPNPAYNGHRWCEVDNDVEVDESAKLRAETWFFLSTWPDNKLDGKIGILNSEEDVDHSVGNTDTNTTAIPPSNAVCGDTSNPRNYILCKIARVNEDPTEPSHEYLVQQQNEIASGNFSADHIKWWQLTYAFKTFHPRTLGQKAYADLIIIISRCYITAAYFLRSVLGFYPYAVCLSILYSKFYRF